MFGTVDTTVEGSLLAVLENVYAPVFFNATTWPDSILCCLKALSSFSSSTLIILCL